MRVLKGVHQCSSKSAISLARNIGWYPLKRRRQEGVLPGRAVI